MRTFIRTCYFLSAVLCLTAVGIVAQHKWRARPLPAPANAEEPAAPPEESEQPATPPTPRRPAFGMNLAGAVDYSREWPLVDVFKASRQWMEQGRGPFAYDERGNPKLRPGQIVETLMVREIQGHYPAGDYVCTYEGKGRVEVNRFDVTRVLKESPGRIEFRVVPGDGGILLRVTASDLNDPIRNVHVWMPGFEKAASPFHPLYLKRLEPFGVVRFMDWQRTNNSPVKTWAQRAKMDDARWSTEAGMPAEVMVDLANARQAAPWFCMPHQADDDYVRRFAALVKERLDPKLKVYVEYSNEVWNYGFRQAAYANDEGKRLGLGSPEHHRFYAQRSGEIFGIWEQVFGGRDRLVRVLGTQSVNTWATEQILGFKDAAKHADALAVAPYFGGDFGDPKKVASVKAMSVDQLLDAVAADIDGPNRDHIRRQAALAKRYGLDLIAYEGGQHLVGHSGAENDEALTKLFAAANRHPRMYDLYRKHLDHWFAEGGGVYGVFSFVGAPSKWGSWGVIEYQDQPLDTAPKLRAVLDTLAEGSKP